MLYNSGSFAWPQLAKMPAGNGRSGDKYEADTGGGTFPAPAGRIGESSGEIRKRERLGGLLNSCHRAAA